MHFSNFNQHHRIIGAWKSSHNSILIHFHLTSGIFRSQKLALAWGCIEIKPCLLIIGPNKSFGLFSMKKGENHPSQVNSDKFSKSPTSSPKVCIELLLPLLNFHVLSLPSYPWNESKYHPTSRLIVAPKQGPKSHVTCTSWPLLVATCPVPRSSLSWATSSQLSFRVL